VAEAFVTQARDLLNRVKDSEASAP
jgi:hypothetical protein